MNRSALAPAIAALLALPCVAAAQSAHLATHEGIGLAREPDAGCPLGAELQGAEAAAAQADA